MSKAKCSVSSAHVLSERRVKSEKRITVVHQLNRPLRNSLILNLLPRMDSNHDKVIQSQLRHRRDVLRFQGSFASSLSHRSVVVTTHRSETA
jgi:hypothetical protein